MKKIFGLRVQKLRIRICNGCLVVGYLDVFALVLEVDPGVRVAPDEQGEDERADRGRDQHDDQPQQPGLAGRHQGAVIQSRI